MEAKKNPRGEKLCYNAADVNKMRKQLQQANELKVLTLGCPAHILIALAHDLEIANIKGHVVHVVKYF